MGDRSIANVFAFLLFPGAHDRLNSVVSGSASDLPKSLKNWLLEPVLKMYYGEPNSVCTIHKERLWFELKRFRNRFQNLEV